MYRAAPSGEGGSRRRARVDELLTERIKAQIEAFQ